MERDWIDVLLSVKDDEDAILFVLGRLMTRDEILSLKYPPFTRAAIYANSFARH